MKKSQSFIINLATKICNIQPMFKKRNSTLEPIRIMGSHSINLPFINILPLIVVHDENI